MPRALSGESPRAPVTRTGALLALDMVRQELTALGLIKIKPTPTVETCLEPKAKAVKEMSNR